MPWGAGTAGHVLAIYIAASGEKCFSVIFSPGAACFCSARLLSAEKCERTSYMRFAPFFRSTFSVHWVTGAAEYEYNCKH